MTDIAPPKKRLKNPKLYHAKQMRHSLRTTWQETAVAHTLDRFEWKFVWQAPFLVHDREIILDFLTKSPRGIPVAIECSASADGPSRMRAIADKLDNRFRLMKEYFAMGTVAVLTSESSSNYHIMAAVRELQHTLGHTDVIITEPEQVVQAIVTAGEKVFKTLTTQPLRPEDTQGLPAEMEQV